MKTFIFALTICFSLILTADAALNLSVTSYQGGSSIRFGKADLSSRINREVKVRITSTEGKRYQIRHKILNPLVNEQGIRLSDQALTISAVRGSNAFGTLYLNTPEPLTYSDSLVYSSNNNGDSDSFVFVYSLNGSRLDRSGTFRGRLCITLVPQGGAPQNVFLDIKLDSQLEPDISFSSSSGGKKVRLDTGSKSKRRDSLVCRINTPMYGNTIIRQRFESMPVNEQGQIFPLEVLQLSLSGYKQGTSSYNFPRAIPANEVNIYSSQSGKQDNISINLEIYSGLINSVPAGIYRGKLLYTLESGREKMTFPIDLEIQVKKIFDLQVSAKEDLSFSKLDPAGPPREKTINLKIKSNLGRPYQVIQKIPHRLINLKGNDIPEDLFTMKKIIVKESGDKEIFSQFTPVTREDTLIFNSNSKGDPAEIELIYRVTPSYEIIAGTYSTKIIYSLSER